MQISAFVTIFSNARTAIIALVSATLLCTTAALAEDGDLVSLVGAARAAGEDAPDIAKMALVDATSRHLRRIEGDIDFPFSVGIDLPVDAQPRDLAAVFAPSDAESGRFAVVFDIALAKVSRKVRGVKDQTSRKVLNVSRIDNPAFLRAVKLADASSRKLERLPGNEKLIRQAEDAQRRLLTTPRYLEQPIYGSYVYRLADVEGMKALTVNYVVIDKATKRYVKSVFDVVEREHFRVAYDVDASDPAQNSLGAEIATERQVRDWERAPVVVPLSQVLDHAIAAGGPTRPVGALTDLLNGFARDRSAAVARAAAEVYDDRPLNDPRFDSVVAIYTPSGMGSGFYVRSNVVMTNWHVVKQHPIIEMRLYDKRETFGQVIAKDVRLDLALVKVQERGRPVEFFQGKDVSPGDKVEAIGHPKRQLFTITRGIVSAIRKHSNQGMGEPVLYIQTDADTNPGNSGGPLFKGNKVVGIVAWGATTSAQTENGPIAVPAPGLNFTIHYAEAKRFLDQSMKGE